MCQLIESIRISDGQAELLEYHKQRMRKSMNDLFGQVSVAPGFEKILEDAAQLEKGVHKLRIIYDDRVSIYEYLPYKMKKIESIKLIEKPEMSYSYKFLDRRWLDECFDGLEGADDFVICKHGKLTDSYYCNIALLKNRYWYTPRTPLLEGTRRAFLLEQQEIRLADIYSDQLEQFEGLRLYNALIPFGDLELPMSAIRR